MGKEVVFLKFEALKIQNFVELVMCKAGLSEQESRIFADSLLKAEMRGISSHGLTRLSTYAKRVELGLVAAGVTPELLQDGKTVLRIDGKNGMGAWIGTNVMATCIQRAKEYGNCFASVCGGNHFGYAAYYTEQAAKADMIGLAIANGPSALPPTGGKRPVLGTNPVAISIPAGRYRPLTLDMATSAVARGKVALAKKNGTSIPAGWGLDEEGRPTTDPEKVLSGGSMLPMGGPKGYAISMIVEIMCSCLSGAANGQTMGSFYNLEKVQNSGYCFAAFDISKMMDVELFKSRVDDLFDSIKACPKAEGVDNIMIPGEIEATKFEQAQREGVSVSQAVYQELVAVSEHYSVALPPLL